jgi:homopolymeric O-antigen transport system ATP-binding protein
MSSDEIAIRVQNLSKCYELYGQPQDRLKQSILPRLQRWTGRTQKNYFNEFWALHDVTFEVKRGETVGIIGRNGSGKSTLLQLICDTLSPTCGSVAVQGRVAALLELGAGFNPEFTGRENVYMNGALLGLTQQEIDARFEDIAAFADIGEFIEQPVRTYSSGMYVRLAFAVIAHVNADILVIDEALAVGDAFFTQKCMRFIRTFKEMGTLLFVSHDTASIINLCSKAIWLDKGTIRETGSAKKVSESYMEGLYEAQRGESVNPEPETSSVTEDDINYPTEDFWDQRMSIINSSPYRNDLEIFTFDENAASFGEGGAKVVDVRLYDDKERPLSWVVGGETVALKVQCVAIRDLSRPIIGFCIKDKLGQTIFAENTFNPYQYRPLIVLSGLSFQAQFEFRMPLLPVGDYSVAVAIAEGTQNEHFQHHWVHDALIFKAHSSVICHGLIGIPMKNINLKLL